jgi:endonuclease/exonuclease/phosphatase family metal-dependent hydrolase
MIPDRISMVSYNLWNVERWPEREPALRHFLTTFQPDILCLQELRKETIECINETLVTHDHVNDVLPGWSCESNIYWNKHYFSEVTHGQEKLDMSDQHRGLFWVRLKLKDSDKTIFIATAHFTWQGAAEEIQTGHSPRNKQARQTIEYLQKLVYKQEPAFFMGDLNDPIMPSILFPEANYHSCFKDLGLLAPPTCPATPTAEDIGENQVLDWIFSNGKAKGLSACVPQTYMNDISPSDHWPVHAIYQL